MPRMTPKKPRTGRRPKGAREHIEGSTLPRDLERYEEAEKVLSLRLEGYSIRAIAGKTGLSKTTVHRILKEWVSEAVSRNMELASEIAMVNLGRWEELVRALWPKAKAGDVQAVNAVVNIIDREMKYVERWLPDEEKQRKANEALKGIREIHIHLHGAGEEESAAGGNGRVPDIRVVEGEVRELTEGEKVEGG